MTCHYRFSFLFLFKKNAPKTVAPIFLLAIQISNLALASLCSDFFAFTQ